jgi:hypothetical protein
LNFIFRLTKQSELLFVNTLNSIKLYDKSLMTDACHFIEVLGFVAMNELKHQYETAYDEPDSSKKTLESSSTSCRLLDAAVKVNNLLSDVESRAVALDAKSDCFRSVASNIGQLSDVISHLMCLNQRLAWFVWRSIASLVDDLMEHNNSSTDVADSATSNEPDKGFSMPSDNWQLINSRVDDDEMLKFNGRGLSKQLEFS